MYFINIKIIFKELKNILIILEHPHTLKILRAIKMLRRTKLETKGAIPFFFNKKSYLIGGSKRIQGQIRYNKFFSKATSKNE